MIHQAFFPDKGWTKACWGGSTSQQAVKALASGATMVQVGECLFDIKEFVEENARCMGSVPGKYLNTYTHNGWEVKYEARFSCFRATKGDKEFHMGGFDEILERCV